MRLAYLCNVYPAVSHSFVRREIEAVEAAGHEVHRFSHRRPGAGLKDEADLREAALTESILEHGVGRLCVAAVALLFSRPAKTFAALCAAFRLSSPGLRSRARHLAYWLQAAWLVRRMEQLRIEHLHAHFGTNPAAVAAISSALGGPPFSFTAHGPDEFDSPVALSLTAKIAAATFVAGISSYGRAQLMRWSEPEDWTKVRVIRCGVDAAFLTPTETRPSPRSIEFVCVARLSAQKGLPLLIAACAKLREAGEQFRLTIIGDGELRATCESEIRRRNLGDMVALAGVRSAREIRDHLLTCRALVLPSFAEGLPVVLMEALALSRPVIATAIAGIPELVDAKCGWLIPAGSEDALVQAMTEALHASPDELADKGKVGRERVHRLHDARQNAQLIIEAISAEGLPSSVSAR